MKKLLQGHLVSIEQIMHQPCVRLGPRCRTCTTAPDDIEICLKASLIVWLLMLMAASCVTSDTGGGEVRLLPKLLLAACTNVLLALH